MFTIRLANEIKMVYLLSLIYAQNFSLVLPLLDMWPFHDVFDFSFNIRTMNYTYHDIMMAFWRLVQPAQTNMVAEPFQQAT